jgi:hypothetical protein
MDGNEYDDDGMCDGVSTILAVENLRKDQWHFLKI